MSAPAPQEPSDRLKRLEAPYGSQHFAEGGGVQELSGGGKFGVLRSYLQAIHDVIKKPITVGVDTNVVPKIVADGRFKSQFETGTSNGSYEPDYRAKFEKDAFGLPLDLPVEKRPIYGHVADRDTLNTARLYGDWGAVLDPKVNERSTFYLGDSLGSRDPYGPYPFKPPSEDEKAKEMLKAFVYGRYDGRGDIAAFTPRNLKGLLDAAVLPGRYVEAQIHDGLPWSDVRALISKREFGHLDDAAEALQKIADLSERPTFAPMIPYDRYDRESMKKMNPEGDYTLRWMRADPGYETHKVQQVPVSVLAEFGYQDGGEVRPLMTAYDGQYYNDGGAVEGYAGGGEIFKKLARLMVPTAKDAGTTTGWTFKGVAHPHGRMEPGDWRQVSEARDTGNYYDVELPISSMYATQNRVNPDFMGTLNTEPPFVIKKGADYFLQDGHHRAMRAAAEGNQTMPVRLVDVDGTTEFEFPLLAALNKLRGMK